MGGSADDEIPLPVMLFYLFHDAAPSAPHGVSGSSLKRKRAAWETTSGGEFGWGGTSVKR